MLIFVIAVLHSGMHP